MSLQQQQTVFIVLNGPRTTIKLPDCFEGVLGGVTLLYWKTDAPVAHPYIQLKFTGNLETRSVTDGGCYSCVQLPVPCPTSLMTPELGYPLPVNIPSKGTPLNFTVEMLQPGESPNMLNGVQLYLWLTLDCIPKQPRSLSTPGFPRMFQR